MREAGDAASAFCRDSAFHPTCGGRAAGASLAARSESSPHPSQTAAGNAERLAIVERHLRERLAELPDEGQTEDGGEMIRKAKELAK